MTDRTQNEIDAASILGMARAQDLKEELENRRVIVNRKSAAVPTSDRPAWWSGITDAATFKVVLCDAADAGYSLHSWQIDGQGRIVFVLELRGGDNEV